MQRFLTLLPVFPVIFPVVSAPVVYLALQKRQKINQILTLVCTLLTSAFAFAAVIFAPNEALTVVDFGKNADVSLTLSFAADGAGKLFALMAAGLWPIALLYAFAYLKGDEKQPVFYLFYTLSFGMTCGVAFARNLLTMYVFFEMLTLATIPLVMHGYTKAHRRAALKYAAYSLGGAAVGFAGLCYLLYRTGSTDFVYGGLLKAPADAMAQIMFLVCFFGFGVKAAVFPLCSWLPEASVAPTPVTALLHAMAVVKAGAFALLRLVYFSFGQDALKDTPAAYIALSFALFTVLYGAVRALRCDHLKRRMAWSTVSNLSYIAAGIMLCSRAGLFAAYFHIWAHALTKITLFFCVGSFMHETGGERLKDLDGAGKKMPLTFASFALAACSLTGIPVFIGFFSKWQLLTASIEKGGVFGILSAFVLLIAALLTAIYTFTPLLRAYFPKNGKDALPSVKAVKENRAMTVTTAILALATLISGFFAAPIFELISKMLVY